MRNGRFSLPLLVFVAQLTYAANPYPTLSIFTAPPSTVVVNQSFTVRTDLLVNAAVAAHAGVSISFPSLTALGASGASYSSSQGSVTTDWVSSGVAQTYADAGRTLACWNGTCPAQHLLAEADWPNVPAANYRYFDVTVTPKVVGAFKVRIRAWVTTNGYANVWRDPTSGYYDQQGWAVYEYTVNATAPTLYTSLQANPSSGTAPLNTSLSASASGSATGTINYTIWWNCTYTGTSVSSGMAACGSIPTPSAGSCTTNSNGYKCDGVTNNPLSVAHVYSSANMYTAKVVTERGSASPAEARTTITVNAPQTLYVSLSATPSSGTAPLTTTLSAVVTGTATGTINYTMWWNCSDTGTNVSSAMNACGTIPATCTATSIGIKCDGKTQNPLSTQHRYAPGANYQAKVIVERGTAEPAQAQTSLAIAADSSGPKIGMTNVDLLQGLTMNTGKVHLDTYFNDVWFDSSKSRYQLVDISRRSDQQATHGHYGQMSSPILGIGGSDIETKYYDPQSPLIMTNVDDYWDTPEEIAGVYAQVHTGMVYDYLLQVHGINSFDNSGGTMENRVGYPNFDNAEARKKPFFFFWTSRFIAYGDHQGVPYSKGLDIVGHEWGHALNAMTGKATGDGDHYQKEPGALNEAFADWLGVAIEFFYGKGTLADRWTMGEAVFVMRDLSGTPMCGWLVGSGEFVCDEFMYTDALRTKIQNCVPDGDSQTPSPTYNDACYVHTLNGIPNKMFYLLSQGGSQNGISVLPITVEKAIAIA